MTAYAFVSVLVPLPESDGRPEIPAAWLDSLPAQASIASDIIDEDASLEEVSHCAGLAMRCWVERDGWPGSEPRGQ